MQDGMTAGIDRAGHANQQFLVALPACRSVPRSTESGRFQA